MRRLSNLVGIYMLDAQAFFGLSATSPPLQMEVDSLHLKVYKVQLMTQGGNQLGLNPDTFPGANTRFSHPSQPQAAQVYSFSDRIGGPTTRTQPGRAVSATCDMQQKGDLVDTRVKKKMY